MRLTSSVLLLVLTASCASQPKVSSASRTGHVRAMSDSLDARVRSLLAKHHVPAVGIALVEDGRIVIAKVYRTAGARHPRDRSHPV